MIEHGKEYGSMSVMVRVHKREHTALPVNQSSSRSTPGNTHTAQANLCSPIVLSVRYASGARLPRTADRQTREAQHTHSLVSNLALYEHERYAVMSRGRECSVVTTLCRVCMAALLSSVDIIAAG